MVESGRWEHRRRARRRALQALYQWQLTRQGADEIIQQFLQAQDFEGVDEALFRELVEGVIASDEALGERLAGCLERPLAQCDVMERVILLMGAWQLLHAADLPHQVILEESVDLATRFGSAQSPGFVNGVLDHAARQWRGVPGDHA